MPLIFRSLRVAMPALLALASVACAAETEEDRPELWRTTSQKQSETNHSPVPVPPCEENAQRACQIIIDLENGVHDCWQGVQFCVDGLWTDCVIQDEESGPIQPD